MAGEVEEPFRLSFQVDSVHSGSISFGRFESEALCWERRSSFSHNRYLEEVEKCSKPGSVTEKKAYFEAHFRKKGFPGLSSPESQNGSEYQTGENDIPEKMGNDEEIDHMNSARFDESADGSVQDGEHDAKECGSEAFLDLQFELTRDSATIVEFEGADDVEHESGMKMADNLDGQTASLNVIHVLDQAIVGNTDATPKEQKDSTPKVCPVLMQERTPSEAKCMKPRSMRDDQRRRYTSNHTSKGSEKRTNKTVPLRSKAEKTSEAPKKYPTHRTPKHELGSKVKGVDKLNRAEKESVNRTIAKPQSSTQQKASNRVHQSANRVKPAVGVTKPNMRQHDSRFSFKSDERAQRRKEFDMKLEGKMHAREAKMHQLQAMTQEKKIAELKQLRKSLDFKAIATPSFYRGGLREPDENKAMAGNDRPQKLRPKSSNPGIRVSGSSAPLSAKPRTEHANSRNVPVRTMTDQQQASGTTSCHSTVTSDSSASSHAVRHPSRGGTSMIDRKKQLEKEKLTNNGKTFDGKPKTRTGRSTYTSINSSSRS